MLITNYLFPKEITHLSGTFFDKLANKLFHQLFDPELAPEVEGDRGPVLEQANEKVFKQEVRSAIHSVLSLFLGERIDEAVRQELSTILAGNWESLKRGISFKRWDGSEPTWALLHVRDIEKIPTRKGRMYRISLRSYAGETAGMDWHMVMAGGYIQKFIREIGCSKYNEYADEDVSGMWVIAQIQMQESRINFLEFGESSSQIKANRELYKRRDRVCVGPSKFHKKHRLKCSYCRFSRSECPLSRSMHSHDIKKQCENGHMGFFRRGDDRFCLSCLQTNKYRKVLNQEWIRESKKRNDSSK